MNLIKKIRGVLSYKEQVVIVISAIVLVLSFITRTSIALEENNIWVPVAGGAYREGVIGQPIALNPIISSNPVDEDISKLIYSSLTDLIQDYEIKEDGKVYVLKLKEGLRWDDDQPLNANDVIFTIETVQDPTTRSPLAKSWNGVVAERISEVRVSLTLRNPYVFFEENMNRLPIIPKHIFGSVPSSNLKLSSYNLEPVGSGPYRLKELSRRRDGFITSYHLVANENYSKEKPFVNDFYFKFYEDIKSIENDFALRKIDGFGSLNLIDEKNFNSGLAVNKIPMPRYYAIFFNPNTNPVLKDKNLRIALQEAINKESINKEIFSGNAEMINGPLGKFMEVGTEAVVTYNPEDAKKKIDSSNTKKISLTLITPKVDFLISAAEMIKSDWLAAGINEVNIVSLSPDELLENVVKPNNYEMILFGNALDNTMDLYPFWHSSQRFYPGLNLALYKNVKVDNLLETLRRTPSLEERKSIAQNAQSLITQDNPAAFLFSLPYTYIHTQNLLGFYFQDGKYVARASDRFNEINKWYFSKVRVIR
ncbi:MAG: peptide ABC transporter substrate-binding protein [Patescibacteria group bacterium]